MPDTSRSTHAHRSRSHSYKRSSDPDFNPGYLHPVMYFSGAIVILVFAKLLHAGLLSPALGSLGIITLAISNIRKSKSGIVFSIICIGAMASIYVWNWVNICLIVFFTAEFSTNISLFVSGLTEGLILTLIAWIYQGLLYTIYKRMGQKWFVKKSFVLIFRMLFYSLLFLFLIWMIAFVMQIVQPLTRLSAQDSSMVAGALALLASGIPAIIYMSKSSPAEKNRHRHVHHHRHSASEEPKNPEIS